MKLNYEKILNYHTILTGKINDSKKSLSDLILPRKVSASIARNINTLGQETELWNQQRDDIVARYVKKDSGNHPMVDEHSFYIFKNDEDKSMFSQEMEELNKIEVDIDIAKFDADALDLCDSSERYDIITPAQESLISWMINYDA